MQKNNSKEARVASTGTEPTSSANVWDITIGGLTRLLMSPVNGARWVMAACRRNNRLPSPVVPVVLTSVLPAPTVSVPVPTSVLPVPAVSVPTWFPPLEDIFERAQKCRRRYLDQLIISVDSPKERLEIQQKYDTDTQELLEEILSKTPHNQAQQKLILTGAARICSLGRPAVINEILKLAEAGIPLSYLAVVALWLGDVGRIMLRLDWMALCEECQKKYPHLLEQTKTNVGKVAKEIASDRETARQRILEKVTASVESTSVAILYVLRILASTEGLVSDLKLVEVLGRKLIPGARANPHIASSLPSQPQTLHQQVNTLAEKSADSKDKAKYQAIAESLRKAELQSHEQHGFGVALAKGDGEAFGKSIATGIQVRPTQPAVAAVSAAAFSPAPTPTPPGSASGLPALSHS